MSDLTLPRQMMAAQLTGYGSADRLSIDALPVPVPGGGEVLVRVRAAGLNPIDYRIRKGELRWLLPTRFPVVLGYDIAGDVVPVPGKSAPADPPPGTRVFSYLPHRIGGGYAQYVVLDASRAIPIPDSMSYEEAAAIPLAGSTALQSLRDIAQVQPGDCVALNGASGGVGHLAVQIAKALGAEVTAVCSADNLGFVRSLGADEAIDYRTADFAEAGGPYNAIMDIVANRSFGRDRKALKPGGTWVTTVPHPASIAWQAATWFGRKARHVLARSRRSDLMFLARLAADRRLVPTLQEVFPLDEVATAHRLLEGHHVRGKLVLRLP